MDKKINILVIEDDEDVSEATSLMIKAKGYNAVKAFTYEEGLEKARKIKPDVIILDVMLKDKSGFHLSYELRKDKATSYIPILMITAINQQGLGFEFAKDKDGQYMPVDEFINKPAHMQELHEKLEKLLKKKVSSWVDWPEKKEE